MGGRQGVDRNTKDIETAKALPALSRLFNYATLCWVMENIAKRKGPTRGLNSLVISFQHGYLPQCPLLRNRIYFLACPAASQAVPLLTNKYRHIVITPMHPRHWRDSFGIHSCDVTPCDACWLHVLLAVRFIQLLRSEVA